MRWQLAGVDQNTAENNHDLLCQHFTCVREVGSKWCARDNCQQVIVWMYQITVVDVMILELLPVVCKSIQLGNAINFKLWETSRS